MIGVSNTTRHGITSPLRRSTRQFATAEKGRSAVARFLVVLAMLFPLFTVFATNANPASAFNGGGYLPTALPATLARLGAAAEGAGSITAVTSVGSVSGLGLVAPIDVAAAGLSIGYGIGTAGTWGVKALWKFASSTPSTYGNTAGTPGMTLGWSSYGNPTGITPTAHIGSSTTITFQDAYNNYYGSTLRVFYRCAGSAWDSQGYTYVVKDSFSGLANPYDLSVTNPSSFTTGGGPYCNQGGNTGWTFDAVYVGTSSPASGKGWYALDSSTAPNNYQSTSGTAAGAAPITATPTRQCAPVGGATHDVAGTAVSFKRSDTTLPPLVYPGCPAGEYSKGTTTPTKDATGTALAPIIPTTTVPAIPNGFPQCQPAGTCILTLLKVAPDGSTVICNGTDTCEGWETQPRLAPARTVKKLSTATGTNTSGVASDAGTDTSILPRTWPDGSFMECKFGPYELDTDECLGVPTSKDPNATPTEQAVPDEARNCISGMFSFNPIDWVFVPVKCALKWAFVPTGSEMSDWQGQVNGISHTGVIALPATLFNYVKSVADAGKTDQGCPTEEAGTFDNGKTVVTKTSPIHWCDIITAAGTQTQSTTWGQAIYLGSKIMLCLWFAFLWYNRISASAGSQAQV